MLNRTLTGSQWTAVAAVAVAVLLASVLLGNREGPGAPETARRPVIVDVRGDVNAPGVHVLEGPSPTTADAVAAAGGFSIGVRGGLHPETASRPVRTGWSLHLARNATGSFDVRFESMPAAARLALGLRLDLNEASEEDLLLVPHMKPEIAKAIVDRRRDTPWMRLDELATISGVGPRSVQKWRDYLRAGEAD